MADIHEFSQGWSIGRLAEEFRMDRRTASKRLKEAGIEVEPIHVALWGIPTATAAFAIHAFRLHRLDKQLAREIAAENLNAKGEQA